MQACEKKVRAATLERDGALALQSANANQITSVASGVASMQSASKTAKQEVVALKAQLEAALLKDVKGVAAAAEAAAAAAISAIEAAKQAEANAEVKAAAAAEAEEKKAEAEGKRLLAEEALEAAHMDVITAQAASEATEVAALAAVEEATSVGVATAQEYEAAATKDKEAAAVLKAAEAAAATAATSLLGAEAKGKSTLADAEALGLALGAVEGKAAKAAINVESLVSAEASLAKLVEAMPAQASLRAATASQLKVASKTLAALKAQVLSDGLKAEAASTASATAAVLLEAEEARDLEAREARKVATAEAEGAREKLLATRAAAAAGSEALEAAENALQTATLAGAESIKAAVVAAAAATVTETKANAEWAAAAEVANEAAAASAEAKAEDEAAAAAVAEAEAAKVDAKVLLDSAKAKRADGIVAALSAKEEEVKLRVEQAAQAASSAAEEAERLTGSASSMLAAAEHTLYCHLEEWERNVDQLAVKETTVCGLDARIAELKADILVKVAAHDALQLASAALSRAAAANDSKAVLAAAKEVELASNDISRVIGDPQKSRRDLLEALAREEAPVVVAKQARQVALALNFIPPAQELCLLKPVQIPMAPGAPLLVYIPGLDGTGQGIRRQIEALHFAGYDVRCVYIPPTDRSTWQQLASAVLPLVEAAARENASGREFSHATLLSESFFAPLALRLAAAAPALVSRLVS
jgi:pimeloyl-ACP methyl ester carboxylesterase